MSSKVLNYIFVLLPWLRDWKKVTNNGDCFEVHRYVNKGTKMDDVELIPEVKKYSKPCRFLFVSIDSLNMNSSFIAWVCQPLRQKAQHRKRFPTFVFFFFSFSGGLQSCTWEKFGRLKWELRQKSNSRALEVVKDICLWPQTPPAAAALIQVLLQGLSQALTLGIALKTFYSASALPVFLF